VWGGWSALTTGGKPVANGAFSLVRAFDLDCLVEALEDTLRFEFLFGIAIGFCLLSMTLSAA